MHLVFFIASIFSSKDTIITVVVSRVIVINILVIVVIASSNTIITIVTVVVSRDAFSWSAYSLPCRQHHHFQHHLLSSSNATSPNLHRHQHYFAWSFIIIIVPPSSLSLSSSIGIILHHDFGEDWFQSLTFTILMGVTTAHFPGGDQIIARLHSIFILVQVSLHFPLARITFDRLPFQFRWGLQPLTFLVGIESLLACTPFSF